LREGQLTNFHNHFFFFVPSFNPTRKPPARILFLHDCLTHTVRTNTRTFGSLSNVNFMPTRAAFSELPSNDV
jgi:hypothetical protein